MDRHHKNLANNNLANASASASSCELVEDRIHELMDLRQPLLSDELIRDHIKGCDQCAALIVDFGALNESLSQIPLETLHRLSGLQAAPEERRQHRVHPVSFVASVACLLLVCLTSGIWFAPSQDEPIATRIEMVSTPLPAKMAETGVQTADVQMTGVQTERTEVGISDSSGESQESQLSQLILLTPSFHNTSPSAAFINTVSLERISGGVEPYQDYIDMTAELPGIQPVSNSVNATYHIIRSISERPGSDRNRAPNGGTGGTSGTKGKNPEAGPDVGHHDLLAMQLYCV